MKHWLLIVPFGAVVVLFVLGIYSFSPETLERSETWVNRVEGFIYNDPDDNTQGNNATMAIATGGLIGRGIGNTTQGRFLSESHNDFIFAIILEEGGVLYGIVIMLLYFILFYRSVKIANNARGLFGRYTAIGIGLVFSLQAVINMAVATTLIPVTGQTLPFISYGGTSFVISSAALGIMLNISAESKKYENKKKLEQAIAERDEEGFEEGVAIAENNIDDSKTEENESNN